MRCPICQGTRRVESREGLCDSEASRWEFCRRCNGHGDIPDDPSTAKNKNENPIDLSIVAGDLLRRIDTRGAIFNGVLYRVNQLKYEHDGPRVRLSVELVLK